MRSKQADRCRFCGGIGVHAEDCSAADPENPDFTNLDLLDATMADGDDLWLAKVREFCRENGMSDEEIETSIAHQRLRRDVHEADRKDLEERVRSGPGPTAEELAMGGFLEAIEPQVRDAVVAMRRKGYATASSGFDSLDAQSIVLAAPDLLDLTTEEAAALEGAGASLSKNGNGFSFRVKTADLAEIKKTWDKLVDLLPDLGRPAPDATHGAAKSFREKFGGKKAV